MKKTIYIFYAVVSAGLALYMLMPSQNAISEFPSLPNSIKSSLEGDTTQIPNVVAYFSNNYRSLSVNYFARNYMMGTFFPFEPLRFNYPPEFAFAAIKDQTQSTYLEELTYPLRDSLFINGLEPFDEITKEKRFAAASDLVADDGNTYETKVTLRYYPSKLWVRVSVWFGINLSVYLLLNLYRKVLINA